MPKYYKRAKVRRMKSPTDAMAEAVKIAGSQSALGRVIGRNQSTIHSWASGRTKVSPQFCADIERATGGKVRRCDLRPDVFGRG